MKRNFFMISFFLASLVSLSFNLSVVGLDFYGQTEIFLINYYSFPAHFQEAQRSEPNPIILAVEKACDRLVRVLINLCTNVNLRNKDGISPLLWAVNKNNDRITQILLNYHSSPNNSDSKGWMPLMLAAQNNNLFITCLLIEASAGSSQPESKSGLGLEVRSHSRSWG